MTSFKTNFSYFFHVYLPIYEIKNIICTVPDSSKAQAIKNYFEGNSFQNYLASILKNQESKFLFLDEASAKLFKKN